MPPNIADVHKLLIVDDDPGIRDMLVAAFNSDEYHVLEAEDGATALTLMTTGNPHVMLLDLGLPDESGLQVIESVRAYSNIPIIVVSGSHEEDLKIRALEAGADDYVTKPFSVGELLARVRVVLRRLQPKLEEDKNFYRSEDLEIDFAARRVTIRGEEMHLTPIEFKLLTVLTENAGKVITHRQLLKEVWGPEYSDDTQYLRVYVGYLRKKIELNPENPRHILNEPRIGYRFVE